VDDGGGCFGPLVAAGEQDESRQRPKLSCIAWQVGLGGPKLAGRSRFPPARLLLPGGLAANLNHVSGGAAWRPSRTAAKKKTDDVQSAITPMSLLNVVE